LLFHLLTLMRGLLLKAYPLLLDHTDNRFVAALGSLARARLAEVEQIIQEMDTGARSTERVSRVELLDRVRSGEVVVLDVRSMEEYEAGHIPGAASVPLEHLEAHFDYLDPDVEVVAYCRGPLCLLAPQAVEVLRKRGYHARCLEDGMPEWRRAGLEVAEGQGDTTLTGLLASRRLPGGG